MKYKDMVNNKQKTLNNFNEIVFRKKCNINEDSLIDSDDDVIDLDDDYLVDDEDEE